MDRAPDIAVAFGTDGKALARELLEALRPAEGWPRDGEIALKPNLILAKPASSGATTHPDVVAGVLEYLRDEGFGRLTVMEGSWVGDRTPRAFDSCGYRELARRYGVDLVDLQKDDAVEVTAGELRLRVCRRVLDAARLVNLPVLKGHCQTHLTCALKNLKGCIPDSEKRRYHQLGIHRPVALLGSVLRPAFTLVDALCGDPGFEEGGAPLAMGRLFAGTDPVLVDTYAATLLGLDPEEVPYIGMARDLGVGRTDLDAAAVRFLNRGEGVPPHLERRTAGRYLGCVREKAACSACMSAAVQALRAAEAAGQSLAGCRLALGQGFRGQAGPELGVGDCTRAFARHVPGCPPAPEAVRAALAAGREGA